MPTSSRQNMLFYENLRRIRNFYWVDVGIDPYKCGLLEVRPFLLRSLYRLRKRNEPSKKGQRLEAQARQRYKIVPAVFSSISFLPRQKRYGPRSGGCGFANCTAPPAHLNCTSGGIPRHPAPKILPLPGASFTRKVIHMWMWTVYKFSVHNCATDVSQNCLWTDLISAHICLWTNNR